MTQHDIAYLFGFIGAALMVTSYLMKSMLPLRIVALAACVCLVLYGSLSAAIPTLLLYGALIPINIRKTWQIHQLVRSIASARGDTPVSEWLLPHMTRRTAKAGTKLWSVGDLATEMVYLESGKLRVVEYGEELAPGTLVGEIGLLTPDKRRTLTLECSTDCVLYGLSDEAMARLYYQNPKLGYHVMRLVVSRLLRDVDTARAKGQSASSVA